ncbi:MAG: hypothetical protein IT566_18045 [Rhodospirillaceae bacterium]|nr:hypothetical protein [Rhodospirillaceae bacterium]
MQSRSRAFIPALVAALVHLVILAGLLTLGHAPPREEIAAALPITLVPRAPDPEPVSAMPERGLAAAPSTITLPPLTIPTIPTAPPDNDLSVLGGYVGCGLNRALTAEERERCEKQRREFYAGPGPAEGPTAIDLALEKRFARDKAVQDAPILLPCFTSAGPNLLCFLGGALNGFEFEIGSYANTGPPENPLAQPVLPYRPR